MAKVPAGPHTQLAPITVNADDPAVAVPWPDARGAYALYFISVYEAAGAVNMVRAGESEGLTVPTTAADAENFPLGIFDLNGLDLRAYASSSTSITFSLTRVVK